MYYCENCGWIGEYEDTIGDRVFDPSWKDDPEYSDHGSCPRCGDSCVPGGICRDCGAPAPRSEMSGGLCADCAEADPIAATAGRVHPLFSGIIMKFATIGG